MILFMLIKVWAYFWQLWPNASLLIHNRMKTWDRTSWSGVTAFRRSSLTLGTCEKVWKNHSCFIVKVVKVWRHIAVFVRKCQKACGCITLRYAYRYAAWNTMLKRYCVILFLFFLFLFFFSTHMRGVSSLMVHWICRFFFCNMTTSELFHKRTMHH